ncbi:FKBP-type peptidyl-prolyl cis-trans isomerase [uncultured archaeon]|nr:FKBP-type peptidyl-prolyl cis-trans isomerase [uncultured archaeon]
MEKPALAALLLALFLLFSGCAQTAKEAARNNTGGNIIANTTGNGIATAQKGDTVRVDYVGKLQNGTVFDTSLKEEAAKAGLEPRPSYSPLEFTVGAGQMIAGFDAAVVGMREGQERTATLQPSQAYGEWSAERVISIPVANIGNAADIRVGSMLYAQNGAIGRVVEVGNGTNATAKVDFNHELAGKTLVFTIKMVGITKK